MENENTVLVKAVRSFEGAEGWKDETSDPFPVSRTRSEDLKANGLVRVMEIAASAPEPVAQDGADAGAEADGDQKAAEEPANKMQTAPANKAARPARQKAED